MRRLLILLAAILALALVVPAFAAEDKKDMTATEWSVFKDAWLAKKPTTAMGNFDRGAKFPGCWVCNSNPGCRAGYKKTGYTYMVNYVVVAAGGKASPGPGGYMRMFSKTIVQNGVCVHDHVKAAVCDKN